MEIKPLLTKTGDFITNATQKSIQFLTEAGYITGPTTAKLISILIILSISYAILHFVSGIKTYVRIAIIIVSGLLILSIITTFISG